MQQAPGYKSSLFRTDPSSQVTMLGMIPKLSSFFGLTSLEKGCIIIAILGLSGGGVASLILGGLGENWEEIGQGAIFTYANVVLLVALM